MVLWTHYARHYAVYTGWVVFGDIYLGQNYSLFLVKPLTEQCWYSQWGIRKQNIWNMEVVAPRKISIRLSDQIESHGEIMTFREISIVTSYERDGVSNLQPHDCLLNRLFRQKSKKTPKLRVTGLCAGNLPVTGEFPAQMASNPENVSSWWRHHVWWLDLMIGYQDISLSHGLQGDMMPYWCDARKLWLRNGTSKHPKVVVF